MSNICKTVTLRTRKIKKGTQLSFYLDYYPGYRDESTMKVQRHEASTSLPNPGTSASVTTTSA